MLTAAAGARATTLPDGSVQWNFTLGSGSSLYGSLRFYPSGTATLSLANPTNGVVLTDAGLFGLLGGVFDGDGALGEPDLVSGVAVLNSTVRVFGFLPHPGSFVEADFTLRDLDGTAFGVGGAGTRPAPSDPPPLALFEIAALTVNLDVTDGRGLPSPREFTYQITSLPEPESLVLLALALPLLKRKRAPES